jgi:hypothetical protein
MQLGVQILQTKDRVTMLYNQDDQVRHVRLNASHPAKLTPTAMGDSVGHYEGDTLVIDTSRQGRTRCNGGSLRHAAERRVPSGRALPLIDYETAKELAERHQKEDGPPGSAAMSRRSQLQGQGTARRVHHRRPESLHAALVGISDYRASLVRGRSKSAPRTISSSTTLKKPPFQQR